MAKKKKIDLGLILKVVVLALAVVAFCMAFVVSVKFVTSKGDVIRDYTGFQTMFGYTSTSTVLGSEVKTAHLAFSFMATLTFLLPLVGACLLFVNNKIVKIVGVALMLVGAVLMFFVPSFAVVANADNFATIAIDGATRTLGIGAILGGVFSAIGGLLAGYLVFKK